MTGTEENRKRKRDRGSGHLATVIGIWAFLAVFAFLMFCIQTYSGIRANRENVQRALDGFVTRHSIVLYDMVKRGTAETKDWDDELWALLASNELNVAPDGEGIYSAYDGKGVRKWTMTVPVLTAAEESDGCIRLRAEYRFLLDVPFAGQMLGTLSVPLTVTAGFLPK